MIDVTNMVPSQYRGALAAHFTLDKDGIILNEGRFQGEPFYTKYFFDWYEVDGSSYEKVNDTTFLFYLYEEEYIAFNLDKTKVKAVALTITENKISTGLVFFSPLE